MTASTPATPRRRSPHFRPAKPLERGRLAILVALVVLTLGAWTATVYQARTMEMPMGVVARGEAGQATGGMGEMAVSGMAGMADAGWSWDGAATFLVAWAVMMAAMMFPAAAPMILLFHNVHAQRRAMGVNLQFEIDTGAE